MITILFSLLIILFLAIMFFSRNIRQIVMSRLAITGYYASGAWNNLTNSAGNTDWSIARGIIWTTLAALALPLIIALLFVILLSITIATWGMATGSTLVSIPFGITFVVWFIFFQIPRPLDSLPIYGRLIQYTRSISRFIAIICFIPIAIGIVIPNLKTSLLRSGGNTEQEFANTLDKGSMKSEPEMGKFAKIIEDAQLYNQAEQPVFTAQKGATVLVKDLEGKKAGADAEGMTKVMLPNRHGDFQQGNEGWIPTRKLDWNWQSSPAEAKKKAEDEAKAKAIAEAMAKDKITVFPATVEIIGGKMRFKSIDIPRGKYMVSPPDTEVNLGEGRKARDGGLFEVSNDHQYIGLSSPSGQSKITISHQE